MSNVDEIESAIATLPASEREILESRLLARRFGLDSLDAQERAELLASLDEAEAEIDAGSVHSAEELRDAIRGWAGK